MSDTYFSMRNVQFVLYEVMEAEGLCALPRFEEHSREIFDMVLETGKKLCDGTLYPALKEMDLSAPAFKDGRVTVSPVVRELMRECGEGGWIGAHADFDRGGQQLPDTVLAALRFMFSASNYSASVYPFLSSGCGPVDLVVRFPRARGHLCPPDFRRALARHDGDDRAPCGQFACGSPDDGAADGWRLFPAHGPEDFHLVRRA